MFLVQSSEIVTAVLQPIKVMILQPNTVNPWRVLWSVTWREVECATENAEPCMGELLDCLEWRIKMYAVLPILPVGKVPWAGVFPEVCSGFILETVSWWTEPAKKQHEWQGSCRRYLYIIEYV